ncbi:hypothetical protein R5R35_002718 [Gryllus longicercus]|uniref:Uncharacterized protein n=1 Tax=Gryllus longicercus TaxID=2509291 RepID=A0AAN9VVF6_9ORTH
MWENSRHLLLFCVVCGAVGSYLLSVYVLLFAFVACVCIVVNDSKLSGQAVTAIKNFTFPVPCWIKSTITFLMNSYHLSKPLETESGSRRSSPYSPNVSVHRRPSCRTGRFTCLDENTDYANRRNGIGLCSPSPFSNNYSNSYHGFRRHSGFNDSENSSKIEEFSTPQTSPWTRRQNYSGNEFNNVRRVQTVAGPLLATSGLTKRKSNDFGLYVDANSPGLASRIVQYREEGASTSDGVWTHQPQYNSPGQFPMVQLSHSSSSLPVLSPLSSQKASRRSVRVKIAPPDPLGSRLYPLSTKSNASLSSTMQTDQSMKSVLETLKEISRKRIHSQLEDNDDDAAKRQKRCGPPDVLGTQTDDNDGDGENLAKRLREESPRQQELSPPIRPAKRIRNNEILSSLSSSRKLLQGGIKRKTHSLDWSRCSTPVLGKQQKTVNEDILSSPSLGPLGTQRSTSGAQTLLADDGKKASHPSNSGKNIKTPLENERRNVNSLSSGNLSNSVKESQKNSLKTSVVPATKISSPVDDTPWQKDSPFVSVSSPDDIIDDVSALEEKREEDRRSRLMAMMTVISGGEPPVKSAVNPGNAGAGTDASSVFSLGGSFTLPPVSNAHLLGVSAEKPLLVSSPSGWSATATCSTASTVASVAPISTPSTEPLVNKSVAENTSSPGLLSKVSTSSAMFAFGNTTTPLANTSVASNNDIQNAPVTSSNQLPVAPVFGSSPASVTSQSSTPVSSPMVFGSAPLLFGSKVPVNTENPLSSNSQNQPAVSSTVLTTSENISFGNTRQVSFGVAPPSTTSTVTSPVTSSSVFQLRPAASGIGQDNSVSSSSIGFSSATPVIAAATSPSQTNVSKALPFGNVEKSAQNSNITVTSGTSLFGMPANPSATSTSPPTSSFVFGSSGTSAPATGSQIKPGLFSFGNTAVSTPSTLTASNSNTKSIFGSASGSFGQAVETSGTNSAAPNQSSNAQIAGNKIGGFAFDLASEKTPVGTTPSTTTTNVFGNPSSLPISSESKPFTFGSGKPIENPFALNTSRTDTSGKVSQAQPSANPFGTPTSLQKPSEIEKPKENPFSFGGSSTASPGFSAPQTGFSSQPAATSTANNGLSFSSTRGFSQSQPGGGGFSLQTAATPTATFGSPATTSVAANSAFSFASSVSNPAPQSSLFAFGNNSGTSDPQPGGIFPFGGGGTSNNSSGGSGASTGGLFGQQTAPTGPIQPQAVQTPAAAAAPTPASGFQFGASSASQTQVSGAFSFGSTTNPTPAPAPAAAQAPAFSAGGSFQMNAGGFGSGPAMFSIGSGSTAPRARSARARRTK